ncbi:MAG: hypothetical protein AB1633_00070 [Elusimicrobiota bacterium]
MTEELEVLKIVTERLNKENIVYMISGSIALNLYTSPRMTRDIDIVVDLKDADIDRFIKIFQKDFYVDKEMIYEAKRQTGMFNLIHNEYVVKIDFIIKKTSEYQETAFLRKKNISIENSPMWFISPEDLVISKLNWARDSYSEMQLKDVRNLLQTMDNIDFQYIEKWVEKLNLIEIYQKIGNE